ncbi:hypothetical protein [Pedobacter xixiisoli]|uniref:DKNYY family protein n=1 Tax=Pedobacter xixiisoli TaxID=1476464 RepID=A0A286A8X0_9SPHI|nr:hypothetical protein [Pedobacter xixiisoli]SOD18368.1 hypothetical protein SAMN06297358_2964 [Pedobacter xixiisoli]
MKKIHFSFMFLLLAMLACKMGPKKVSLLEKNSAFDLETIDFNEDVNQLFAKYLLDEDGIRYDSVNVAIINSEQQKYKISNTLIDVMDLKVPQKDFGFLYKSPSLDSVAKFQNIYFERMYLLTDNNKKPVGYYAETEFQNVNERKAMMDKLTEKYGKPKYAFFLASDFNQCSYEWVLEDRTIQIETSFGFSTGITTNNGKYYKLDMLILNNKVKPALHQAHIFEFPEKIVYRGKEHSYKDFQFEKKSTFKDEFLLNSNLDYLVKNENNQYDISLAPADE